MSTKILRARRVALAAAVAVSAVSGWSHAVDIVPTFDSAGSANPSFDPTGSGLQSIMNHVIAQYEDTFKDAHTLNLTYRWGDLNGGFVSHTLNSQAGGRELSGTIVFDTRIGLGGAERNWFIDSTPASNSEFNMSQTLWRDLSPAQRTSFFNAGADIPQTFEAGFGGAATAGAPAAAQNGFDLLTYAYSRVGNALGMSSSNTATSAETADGDYDFAPVNVFGKTLAAKSGSGSSIGFLVDDLAMQDEGIANGVTGIRRLPSHADLFSMAKAHNYLQIDAPRREFYNDGGGWTTAANWSGNRVPDGNDDVYIRTNINNGIVGAGFVPAIAARNVFIAGGANLTVGPGVTATFNSLDLRDDFSNFESDFNAVVNVGTINAADTEFTINGGTANATRMNLADGGALYFRDFGGTLTVSQTFLNNGRTLTNNATLIKAAAGGSLNLDGAPAFLGAPETGELFIGAGTATIDGQQSDAFNGYLKVAGGAHVIFTQPWTLGGIPAGSLSVGQDGVIDMQGGFDFSVENTARIGGATVTIDGIVHAVGKSSFDAPTIFNATANVGVAVPTSTLAVSTTTFNGASVTGDGELFISNVATFSGNTTLSVGTVNLDGNGTSIININQNATATLNVGTIESGGVSFDGFDGVMNINGGTLVMNTNGPWRMQGTMNLNMTNGVAPVVGGSPLILHPIPQENDGRIFVVGKATIDAPLRVEDTGPATITTNAGGGLLLKQGFATEPSAILHKNGAGTMTIEGFQDHKPGAVLNINAGKVTMLSNAGDGGQNLDVNVTGQFQSYNGQDLDQLAVNAGGDVEIVPYVNGISVLNVKGYSIAGTAAMPSGKIDLGNNAMIIDHNGVAPTQAIRQQIKAAYNNGNWNGNGIGSDVANSSTRAIGYAESQQVFGGAGVFLNDSVDSTATLLRYTVYGDADLNGTTNINDFALLAANFNTAAVWYTGDFNYDGVTTIADFALMAANFNQSLPADLPRGAAVPEPTVAAIALGGLFAARRRRR